MTGVYLYPTGTVATFAYDLWAVIGTTNLFIYLPLTAFLVLKLAGRLPAPMSS